MDRYRYYKRQNLLANPGYQIHCVDTLTDNFRVINGYSGWANNNGWTDKVYTANRFTCIGSYDTLENPIEILYG